MEAVAEEVERGIGGWSGESSQWSAGAAVLPLVSAVVAVALLLMGGVGGGFGKGSWWSAVSVESVAAEVEEGIRGWSGESSQWSAGQPVVSWWSAV